MMKRFLAMFFLCILFVLSACGLEYSQDIVFEGKSFSLETNGQRYVKISPAELPDFYLGGNIKASYTEESASLTGSQSEFLSSFVFVQHSLSSSVDLKEFYRVNLDESNRFLENIEKEDPQYGFFFCGNKQIPFIIQNFEFYVSLWEAKFYVSQYFYIENDVGTIISFVSDDETECKNFVRSLKSLRCGDIEM